MLGIEIESYGHVLGPPRVSSFSEKILFFRKIRSFFNGLIKKFQNVIKVRNGDRFWRGDTCFHTQSILFIRGTTFHMSQATEAPREALFN